MDRVWRFLATAPGSFLRVFVSAVLVLWLADLADVKYLHFDAAEWSNWLALGLVAAVPILIAWVNPADPRFGLGSEGRD